MLGSSDFGGAFAAQHGLGFAFARHINPRDAVSVLKAYRADFRPSGARGAPQAILALSVICADTEGKPKSWRRAWISGASGSARGSAIFLSRASPRLAHTPTTRTKRRSVG